MNYLDVFEKIEYEFLLNKINIKYRKEIADILSSNKNYDSDSEIAKWVEGKDINLSGVSIKDSNTFYKTMEILKRLKY